MDVKTIRHNVDYAIDIISKYCLIRENLRELERLEDQHGTYRSIMIPISLTEQDHREINDYFSSTKFYFDFKETTVETTELIVTVVKIRMK